jgi:hypothetical protein
MGSPDGYDIPGKEYRGFGLLGECPACQARKLARGNATQGNGALFQKTTTGILSLHVDLALR